MDANQIPWFQSWQFALLLCFAGLMGYLFSLWYMKALVGAIVAGLLVNVLLLYTPLQSVVPSRFLTIVPVACAVIVFLMVTIVFRERLIPRARIQMLGFDLGALNVGLPIAGTASFINSGQIDARVEVFNYVYVRKTPPPAESVQAEDFHFNQFLNHQVTNQNPHVIPRRITFSQVNYGPLLPKEWSDGFKDGDYTFYFVGRVRYSDNRRTRQTDYCRYATRGGVFPCTRHNEELGR